MATWTFHTAGSLVFGRDAVDSVGEMLAKRNARRVMVISDRILAQVGIVGRVTESLKRSNLTFEVFDGVTPEPPVEVIRQAADAARSFKPDMLIGLGGGSNMDAAKLVAVVLAHGGDPTDYVGDCRVPGPVFPLVCIPTTAGTGSEVSAAAVFTDTAQKMKVSTLSPFIRPAIAIVDPSLTDGCPAKVTADSGIDALTHAIEAYCAVEQEEFLMRPPGGETVYQGRNAMSTYMASECIMLCGRFLARAVTDGSDREARDQMALAATLGGLAFSNAGVALVHAMEYPVGGAVHVSHGAGNGLLLPYVMEFNRPVRDDEINNVGIWLSGKVGIDGVTAVRELRKKIGIPDRLREIGVKQDMLRGFAERAFGIKRLMRTNPRMPQDVSDILKIYEAAY